ncbi:hypothetical protein TNCT6_71780 [Streptomyces sp. 6-11-2]|nr:hypothetical protein TNCT6_71780 [Streptomyces sp. 6-11-2]
MGPTVRRSRRGSAPQVLRPLQRPRLELFDLLGGEPVRGIVLVLVPVRADEPVTEVLDAELVVGAAAAEGFEVGGGPVTGGGLDVDEVADGAALGEGSDLGADHVVEGEDGP